MFTGCESVLMFPANQDIRAETFRLLSLADIHEIERLAVAVAPQQALTSIRATSHDEATVECDDAYGQDAKMTTFTARRKGARWVADRSSIGSYRPIIVN
jgi:hypothetical protein